LPDPEGIIAAILYDIMTGAVGSVVVENANEFGLPAWFITILFILVILAPWIILLKSS